MAAGDAVDLIGRLRRYLSERDGVAEHDIYLGAPEHLDRDASGLLVLARNRQANAHLSNQVNQGTVHTTFVLGIAGPGLGRPTGDIQGRAQKDARGGLSPCRRAMSSGIAIRVACKTLLRHGDRQLVEMTPATGWGRHVRVAIQMLPSTTIAGDLTRGGPAFHRVLLHATRVTFVHPSQQKPVTVSAPAPEDFELWVQGGEHLDLDKPSHVRRLVDDAALARFPLASDPSLGAIRLVHGEGEGMPGLDIECYGAYAVVWLADSISEPSQQVFLDALAPLSFEGIHLKIRPKQASRLSPAQRQMLTSVHAARGCDAPDEIEIAEGPLRFAVRLRDGLSTGLFLDQRDNRRWMREHACGKRVLNLFAYSASFTVAAVAGGAISSVTVDSSARILELASRNFALNGIDDTKHVLVCDDVLQWLPRARDAGQRFDIIVLDPPSFSTTHRSLFSARNDYRGLACSCIRLIGSSGGHLIACTNHRQISSAHLQTWLKEACREAGRTLVRLRALAPPLDFPVPSGQEPHMKAYLVEVGPGQA